VPGHCLPCAACRLLLVRGVLQASANIYCRRMYRALLLVLALALLQMEGAPAQVARSEAPPARPPWADERIAAVEKDLASGLDAGQQARLSRGLRQVASLWREEDGDTAAFDAFVRRHFVSDVAGLDEMFGRFERLFEKLDGHMLEILLSFRLQSDLDIGPIRPYDEIFAAFNPAAHVTEDMFGNKLAFAVLLNYPLTTLQERLEQGPNWSRREWAEARLASRFARRVPAAVNQAIARANAEADQYIAEYNIWMHHVLDEQGRRLFPAGMRLLSHWNLRDQIRADYESRDGLPRQRTMQRVMEHIVRQSIPRIVIDNPHVDWDPFANRVTAAAVQDGKTPPPPGLAITPEAEPDTRYATLLSTFQAVRLADPYSPTAPTHIARQFDENRELPEPRVRQMLEEVLSSPLVPKVAKLIETRLGRRLEPFDIWYAGFRPRTQYTEEQLDAITRKRYPDAAAYERDMPRMLQALGFSADRARYLAERIVVQPARGSGHAWGSAMRGAPSRLRTRVGPDGMDYKGYNIAVHEMGHNVEQVLSLYDIDHVALQGVPNTAFTEAMAFVFQARDLDLLGLAPADEGGDAIRVLNDFWQAYEISGVALVDMAVWRWMYDHPDATPAALKDATLGIARDVWNRYYATHFGQRDVVLLGIYSHMIHSFLYLPDYPIGRMIAAQIEEQVRTAGTVGPEIERMSIIGNIAPDLWMERAAGRPVGPEALLRAAERALGAVGAAAAH
jgi:hypothetical protein